MNVSGLNCGKVKRMNSRPKVTAVIVTFNNAKMLKELINDLLAQSYKVYKIIVVDNASKDNTRKMIENWFSEVKYMPLVRNTGSAGGYFEGIKAAFKTCDLIWTLDDDVRLQSDSLEALVHGLQGLDSSMRVSSVRGVGEKHFSVKPTKLELFPWRGTLIKTELIKKYGFPLKELFLYGEDLEYSMRFNRQGFFCFWIPTSKCIEKRLEDKEYYRIMGRTIRVYSKPFQYYYAFRNHLYIFWHYKEYSRFLRTLLYSIKTSFLIIILDRRNPVGKLRAIIEGFIDACLGNLGIKKKYYPQ